MKKTRRLPSYLRSSGFIIILFSAIALPSAGETSRPMVLVLAIAGLALVVAGIGLGIYYYTRGSRGGNEK